MGSHTDYNLGFVLTMAISRDTWIAARRREDGTVRVHSMNLDAEDEFRTEEISGFPNQAT
jgi:galactokinase